MYEAVPFEPRPERAEIVSRLIRGLAAHDQWWSDEYPRCELGCFDSDPSEFCTACARRFASVSQTLGKRDSRVWEVWEIGGDLVGAILLTGIKPAEDAVAYYVFFDRRLKDKEEVLREVIDWCFSSHDEWRALQRLTIEVGRHAAPLALHAQRKLSFGGPFETQVKGRTLRVEGVKRDAFTLAGEPRDVLVLGLLASQA